MKKKRGWAKESRRLERMLIFERKYWSQGFDIVAGVDEAGVGPLAGPVVAAACVLPKDYRLEGLDDSKKIKSEEKRKALAEQLKKEALAWAVGHASPVEIDKFNIYQASLLAMRRAVEKLSIAPNVLLVDARVVPKVTMPQEKIIHGDALSLSIAAASILAKTTRDGWLDDLGKEFPQFGFERHKGYPTKEHFEALKQYGVTKHHRRSYKPVQDALTVT